VSARRQTQGNGGEPVVVEDADAGGTVARIEANLEGLRARVKTWFRLLAKFSRSTCTPRGGRGRPVGGDTGSKPVLHEAWMPDPRRVSPKA